MLEILYNSSHHLGAYHNPVAWVARPNRQTDHPGNGSSPESRQAIGKERLCKCQYHRCGLFSASTASQITSPRDILWPRPCEKRRGRNIHAEFTDSRTGTIDRSGCAKTTRAANLWAAVASRPKQKRRLAADLCSV